jgi:hypothetical protein
MGAVLVSHLCVCMQEDRYKDKAHKTGGSGEVNEVCVRISAIHTSVLSSRHSTSRRHDTLRGVP